jgi:hypothetical protein
MAQREAELRGAPTEQKMRERIAPSSSHTGAVRQDFLRQHYLDQVHGSVALPRSTLSLRAGTCRHRLAPR